MQLLGLINGVVILSSQTGISQGVDVLPNAFHTPDLTEMANLNDDDLWSILRIKDGRTLHHIISDTATYLASRILSFAKNVSNPNFYITQNSDGVLFHLWERRDNNRIWLVSSHGNTDDPVFVNVLNITVAMAKDPFLITKALIVQIWRWDKFQNDVKHRKTDTYPLLESLVELLGNIRSNPDLDKFRSLFRLLSKVFQTSHIFQSPYFLFYYWLYYVEYIHFISAGKLETIGQIGEGTQAVVFKVATSREISSQQIFYALKIYKERHQNHSDWNCCFKEERILNLITQQNAKSFSMTGKFEIQVPVLISKMGIHCDPHSSILMSFVGGIPCGQRIPFTSEHAVDMYTQLRPSIVAMASLGISHNDINGNNVMVDWEGLYWFIDFGHSFLLEHHMGKKHGDNNYRFMVGTWFFSSPDLYHFNHYMYRHWMNVTLPEIEHFIIGANRYSLQALILDRMLGSAREESQSREKMANIDKQLNALSASSDDALFGPQIMSHLLNLWSIRANSLKQYLRRHPNAWNPARLSQHEIARSVQSVRAFHDDVKRKRMERETSAKKMKC